MHRTTPFTLLLAFASAQQVPFQQERQSVNDARPRVAIIGAGIAGASAAWKLRQRDERSVRMPHDITVYEQAAAIGGRVQSTTSSTEGIRGDFETGATHLYSDDWCLNEAMKSVGLYAGGTYTAPVSGEDASTYLSCDFKDPSWSHLAHLTWNYGRSPWLFHKVVASVTRKWQDFAQSAGLIDLRRELFRTSLGDELLQSAAKYLTRVGISAGFQQDVVQPCVRARAFQDLADVSGLAALIAVSGDPLDIKNRNGELGDRMLRLSQADVRLNAKVLAISPGSDRRFRLGLLSTTTGGQTVVEYKDYDSVIIALPLFDSGIDLSGLEIEHNPRRAAFTGSHVTHVATRSRLTWDRNFLPLDVAITNLKGSKFPRADVRTSSTDHTTNILSIKQYIKCDYGLCTPGDECDSCKEQNLYRIHSRHRLSDEDLVQILGGPQNGSGSRFKDHEFSWLHRQHWPLAFPVRNATRHLSSPQVQLASKLFYLGGAEEIVSSMEMSCRMGRMAANWLYYEDSGWPD